MTPLRRKVAFSLVLVLMVLALGEVMARAYFHWDPDLHWRIHSGPAWRIAWVRRHARGIDIFRPGIDLFDPLLGWRNKPGFRNTKPLNGSERVNINSNGARGKREYRYERGAAQRAIVIGDSFAFGWEASDEETYSAVLESLLGDVEVINQGVGGYGTDQMLLMLQSEGIRYRPDLVIVGVVSADTMRNVVDFRDFAKPMFELNAGVLRLENTPVREPNWWLASEPWRPKLYDICRIAADSFGAITRWRMQRANHLTQAIWQEMHRIGKGIGAKTLFMFTPQKSELIWPNAPGNSRELFRRFARANTGDVITLDLTDQFSNRLRRGEEMKMGHWGPRSHAAIARELQQKILAEQLLER